MSAALWSGHGLKGYLGLSPHDGLEWSRHDWQCRPGMWAVTVTGWRCDPMPAVIDDFGNLVQVRS